MEAAGVVNTPEHNGDRTVCATTATRLMVSCHKRRVQLACDTLPRKPCGNFR